MKQFIIAAALCSAACSGGSPSSPTPPPTTPPTTQAPPVIVNNITVAPCPSTITPSLDLGFYQQIGCNAFDGPMQAVRRWNVAPRLYLRTVDDAGAAIDTVTLDTVQNAMMNVASSLTGGKFGLASVERGSDTKEGVGGYVTVKWPSTTTGDICGQSNVAVDGGTILLYARVSTCGCNGSAIRPGTAKHELGHAFGYWHTNDANDLMSNVGATKPCERSLSAREQQAIAYQYR